MQREILPVILEAAWILKRQDAKGAKLGGFIEGHLAELGVLAVQIFVSMRAAAGLKPPAIWKGRDCSRSQSKPRDHFSALPRASAFSECNNRLNPAER